MFSLESCASASWERHCHLHSRTSEQRKMKKITAAMTANLCSTSRSCDKKSWDKLHFSSQLRYYNMPCLKLSWRRKHKHRLKNMHNGPLPLPSSHWPSTCPKTVSTNNAFVAAKVKNSMNNGLWFIIWNATGKYCLRVEYDTVFTVM